MPKFIMSFGASMTRQIVSVPHHRRVSAFASGGMEALEQRQLFAHVSYGVNFQPESAPPISGGVISDNGAIFGARSGGLRYGWNADNRANTRVRNINPNPLQDRLIHLQRGGEFVWEFALPNGDYDISIGAGDPAFDDQIDNFSVEGKPFIVGSNGGFAGGRVTVSDGRLTLRAGAGASNAKLNYINISTAEVTPHAAPSELKGVVQGDHAVKLTWKNNSPAADEFVIVRRKVGDTQWKGVGDVSSDVTTFVDTTVSPGTSYQYAVYAAAAAQIPSEYSNVATITVPAAATASISGRVFNDNNKNGKYDKGDSLITDGRTVFIDLNNNNKLDAGEQKATSNNKGVFSFLNLVPGSYRITRVFPAGFKLSNNAAGYVLVDLTVKKRDDIDLGSRKA